MSVISEPLARRVGRQPFVGSLRLVTLRVLVAEGRRGELLACTSDAAGVGPFSLVVEALPQELPIGARVALSAGEGRLAGARLELKGARLWSPRLAVAEGAGERLVAWAARQGDARWNGAVAGGAIDRRTAERLRYGAAELSRYWAGDRIGEGRSTGPGSRGRAEVDPALARGVAALAGLGPGLTPAGDDYLLGFCAALCLIGARRRALEVAQGAAPRTTRLSAELLLAAGRGEFALPWHRLRAALLGRSPERWRRALLGLSRQGATSGAAAVAGLSSVGRAVGTLRWFGSRRAGRAPWGRDYNDRHRESERHFEEPSGRSAAHHARDDLDARAG